MGIAPGYGGEKDKPRLGKAPQSPLHSPLLRLEENPPWGKMAPPAPTCAPMLRTATLRLGLLYWSGVFVLSSVLWGIVGTDPFESAQGKLIHYLICSLLTGALAVLQYRLYPVVSRRWPERALALMAVLCFALALVAAPIWGLTGFAVYALCIWPTAAVFDARDFGYDLVYGGGLFFGWSCLFLTLLYSVELRDRERRLAAVREEVLTAQMRALRYQINPHFLFNTLNALAGLMEEGQTDKAQRMVGALSGFLRTTLTQDPMQDVPLAQEMALQEEYLGIERERFPDRLDFQVDLPEALQHAPVPSLILQPLVENAVKHGVGRSRQPVFIRLWAEHTGAQLCLGVENGSPALENTPDNTPDNTPGNTPDNTPGTAPGLGVGLGNVAARLSTRFPGRSRLQAEALPAGGFRVTLHLPWSPP